ncbi:MAG: DHA2 family efflux MFS transporter permease subunit [Alphaproteobacteria bacterium]|nr:DHA2 family efflux MFS transporter permease subunit [Alphaproteobacteria bacterium]
MTAEPADGPPAVRAQGAAAAAVATPWIVGAALFLQSLDATIVATALPTMARDFGLPVVQLNTVVTAYLLTTSLFIPLSGWLSTRFGAKRIFLLAIALFTFASLLCGLSQSLPMLVAARCLQGAAGAMLTPIGRILVVQRHGQSDLIRAMSFLGMCVVLGPVMGPPLGGFIAEYLTWHWLFLINLPIGLIALWATQRFITEAADEGQRSIDIPGYLLCAAGLGSAVYGLSQAAEHARPAQWMVPAAVGLALLAGYAAYARGRAHAILDLSLLRDTTFAASFAGGIVLRLGVASSAFLLALMLQIAYGIDPLSSGLIALSSAASALAMKAVARRVIAAVGFRRLLIVNTIVLSGLLFTWTLFRPDTPLALMVVALFAAGFARSLQFTTINTLMFSEMKGARTSAASSLSSTAFQFAETLGVSGAAIALSLMNGSDAANPARLDAYTICFGIVAALHMLPLPLFLRLRHDAGAGLRG